MRYVNAGYIIALSVLFVYAVSLLARRRRLVRAAALSAVDGRARGDDQGGEPTVAAMGSGTPDAGVRVARTDPAEGP